MRIFYASETGPFLESRLWYNNLYLPLLDLGHEVIPFEFPLDEYDNAIRRRGPTHRLFVERNRPKLERALLSQIVTAHDEAPIDVFFSYFWNPHCRPEVISRIRQMGILTLNWYCNASYQFDLVREIAPAYDFCLVPERSRLEDYRQVGARAIYTQEAANPDIYKPYGVAQEFDVVFIGQMYANRADYVAGLLSAGVNVRVWGAGWPTNQPGLRGFLRRSPLGAPLRALNSLVSYGRLSPNYAQVPSEICGGPLSDLEMIQMYNRAKISLGFSTVGETHRSSKPIRQIRLRDFEAPMSGAFYMVECQKELEEFYEVGEEIVCYEGLDDLIEKIRYYLGNEQERERIRKAGFERAQRDHTWQKRLSYALETALKEAPAAGAVMRT